jgi:hypothetical protein
MNCHLTLNLDAHCALLDDLATLKHRKLTIRFKVRQNESSNIFKHFIKADGKHKRKDMKDFTQYRKRLKAAEKERAARCLEGEGGSRQSRSYSY